MKDSEQAENKGEPIPSLYLLTQNMRDQIETSIIEADYKMVLFYIERLEKIVKRE